jgi:hypothetical protein
VKCYIWSIAFYGAKTWTLRAVDQKHLEILKCDVEEGWNRSVEPIMCEMEKYYLESRSRGKSYTKQVNGRLTGLVTFCVETAFYNGLLKERYKGDRSERKTRKKTLEATGLSQGKEKILSFEGGSYRSHCVESLLWTCRKTDY